MANKNEGLETVIAQEWLESEQGWGVRPDGYSLHLSHEDLKKYVDSYWKTMPEEVPYEYSRPCGEPFTARVPAEVYKQVKKSKYGIRVDSLPKKR